MITFPFSIYRIYFLKISWTFISLWMSTFIAFQCVCISGLVSFSNHVGADEIVFVGFSMSSIVSIFQPAVMIVLSHGEGDATFLTFAVIVAITESSTSEIPYVSTPVVNIVFDSSWIVSILESMLVERIKIRCNSLLAFSHLKLNLPKIFTYWIHSLHDNISI